MHGRTAIERREVLRFIGMASAAAAFPGFQRWVFACSRPSRTGLLALKDAYKPLSLRDSFAWWST